MMYIIITYMSKFGTSSQLAKDAKSRQIAASGED